MPSSIWPYDAQPPANTEPVASDLYTMLALGVTAKIVATLLDCYTALICKPQEYQTNSDHILNLGCNTLYQA